MKKNIRPVATWAHRPCFRSCWRVFCGEQGSSTIQQAVLIALIVGAAFLAVDGLGFVASETFGTASHRLHGEGAAIAGRDAIPNTENTATRDADSTPAILPESAMPLRVIALLVACPLGALCWYFLYRPRINNPDEEDDLTPMATSDTEIERDLIFDKRHNLLRLFNSEIGMLMTSRVRVKHVMSVEVSSVSLDTPVDEIRDTFEKKQFRHVLVCDKQGGLVGLIIHQCLDHATANTAADIMQPDPITVESNSLLNPTITQLIKKRLYCLPVVDEDKLVGVVTTTDILMAMQCTLHVLQKSASEAIADLPPGTVPGFMLAGQLEEQTQAG